MRATIEVSPRALKNFNNSLTVTISKVGNGSRKATEQACRDISDESLMQVPYDTGTLASSQFWEVTGDWRTGWTGVIGYGGNGNPVNPKTGKPASYYMAAVHEDLTAHHPLGKAKFLEDPLRRYARENFPRTVIQNINQALAE